MSDQQRRLVGFILGFSFGVPYSLISQYINVWALPGVPFFDLPIGRLEMVILTSLFMGGMGMITAWEEESFWGLIGSSILAVIASSLLAYINSGESQIVTSFFLSLFTFVPRMLFTLPFGLFIRGLLGILDTTGRAPSSGLMRLLKVVASIVAVAVIGGQFAKLSPEALEALDRMNTLTQAGMTAAADGQGLPESLIPVAGFSTYANGPYTLEWSSDVDSLPVTRPVADFGVTESLVIVRFENKYHFGCVFTPPHPDPKCIHITRVRYSPD